MPCTGLDTDGPPLTVGVMPYGRNRAVAEIYHRLRDSGLGKHTPHPLQSISLGKAAHVEHRAPAIQSHRMRRSIERISRTRPVVIRACRNIEIPFRSAAECLAQLQCHEQLVTHGHILHSAAGIDRSDLRRGIVTVEDAFHCPHIPLKRLAERARQ